MRDTNSKIGSKVVDDFILDDEYYVIYGCWDEQTPIGEYDYYDIYRKEGGHLICVNEGEPFYEKPTQEEIQEFMNQ